MNAVRQFFLNLSITNLSVEALGEKGLLYWRERIYTYVLATMAILGFVALVPSVILSFRSGLIILGISDLAAYSYLLVLLFARRLSYRFRASQLILLGIFVGLVVLFFTGSEGGGLFWLFMVPPLASLFFGLRWGSVFLVFNAVLLLGTGYLVVVESPFLPGLVGFTPGNWLVLSVNFLVTNALVTVPLGILLRGLFEGATREKKIVEDYQLLFENNPLPMWVYDSASLLFLAVNEAAINHYGYTRKEFLGLTIKDIRPPEELAGLGKNLASTGTEVRQTSGPWKHLKKDSTVIDVEIFSHSIDFAHHPARLVLANDVTERIKAEKGLREAAEIIYRVRSIVLIIDSSGNIIFANQSCQDILGFNPEELLGEGWWKLTRANAKEAEAEKRNLRMIVKGEAPLLHEPYEREIRTRSGETRWIEWQDSVGAGQTVIGIGIDITERKKWQLAERASEERYRQIVETAEEGIWITNTRFETVFVNQKMGKLLGYNQEEMLGKPVQIFLDEGEQQKSAERLVRRSQGVSEQFEVRYRRKDGSGMWAIVSASPVFNSAMEYTGALAMVTDITERKKAEEKVYSQFTQLRALSEIDQAILSSFELDLPLKVLLKHTVEQLHADACNVMLYDPNLNMLRSTTGFGFRTRRFENREIQLGEGYAGRAALENQLVHIVDLSKQTDNTRLAAAAAEEGFIGYYAVPLVAKGRKRGVLEVFMRSEMDRDEEWLQTLRSFAGQAAIAIDVVSEFQELQRTNAELSLSYDSAIEGWSRALDLRDKETEGHSERVTDLGVQLARRLGMQEKDLVNFRRGALLHDIGKMAIPDSILLKPGPLTEEEWVIMKQHPTHSGEMVKSISFLQEALDIPYNHHEKWDGSGYPRGLSGTETPWSARIFSVVDVFDALTSDRPYRKAWSKKKTINYIHEQAGKYFDPNIVPFFLEMIEDQPKRVP